MKINQKMQTFIKEINSYELLNIIHLDLCLSNKESTKLDIIRFNAWVEVTHETKNKVMARVSEEDFRKVGCRNPDIYVNGRKDDRIVLTQSKTYRNEHGKSRKHITSIRAEEIFGYDWRRRLNVHKLEKLGYLHEQLDSDLSLKSFLHEKDACVVFKRVADSVYDAYIWPTPNSLVAR
ncbi:hypothetical protein SR914_19470 [Comamonas testosteroni]|uniref:Uncharacterized protein n=1 Tax=Comamonas testosteroni (strain DSM 14576 / KF-1) TaxID=399795 RepID=B7WRI1_COMTK|nr:hypothetical protein [Comamonas testosteroni]EED67166.1 hypothetical protein CtesDRAFT_PD2112 [Comamonas testosteroni KF-1]WQG65352.1 hypothetical protein SR914_19470 [Comamonas testosteroni]